MCPEGAVSSPSLVSGNWKLVVYVDAGNPDSASGALDSTLNLDIAVLGSDLDSARIQRAPQSAVYSTVDTIWSRVEAFDDTL